MVHQFFNMMFDFSIFLANEGMIGGARQCHEGVIGVAVEEVDVLCHNNLVVEWF